MCSTRSKLSDVPILGPREDIKKIPPHTHTLYSAKEQAVIKIVSRVIMVTGNLGESLEVMLVCQSCFFLCVYLCSLIKTWHLLHIIRYDMKVKSGQLGTIHHTVYIYIRIGIKFFLKKQNQK